jgi:hypothetical protein
MLVTTKVLKKLYISTLLICLSIGSIQTPVLAGMIDTNELINATSVDLQRAEIRDLLARDDIRTYLEKNGVSAEFANERVNNLTNAEVISMHSQLNNLPAGQGALGTVVLILVIFILLDVAGVTDIFPGV